MTSLPITQCPCYKGNLTGFAQGAPDLGSLFEKDPLQLKEPISSGAPYREGAPDTGDARKGVNARGGFALMLIMVMIMIMMIMILARDYAFIVMIRIILSS